MAKQDWKTINLMDVVGMATNPNSPGNKFAKRLLNVYTHEKPGYLTLRKGYSPKYTPPSESNITNSSFINFTVFYDRKAVENGQEIVCLIQKGKLTALRDETDTPIVPDIIDGFWFWARPYWSGSQWVNSWQLINKTIITKIILTDGVYKSHIKIFGSYAQGIFNDSLIGWTIYNKNKNEYARVLTCKQEDAGTWVNITLYENNWAVDDVLIISRCWIDLDTQQEYYDNVSMEDIVFHRVNDDLRIGFGGKEKRYGLALGYRKRCYQISAVEFPNVHPDINEVGILEKFATIDGLYIDTNIIHNNSDYGFELRTNENGNLQNNIYFFKLTGRADYYSEQLLHEDSIVAKNNDKIEIYPFVRLGRDNYLFTDLKLYYSDNTSEAFLVKEYDDLRLSSYNSNNKWIIDKQGRIILKYGSATELLTEASAVSIINEQNSFGSWSNYNSNNQDSSFIIDSIAAKNGQYSFKMTLNAFGSPPPAELRKGIKIPVMGLTKNKYYTLSCYLSTPNYDLYEDFEDTNYIPNLTIQGIMRVNTGNPHQGQWHLYSDPFQTPLNTDFPYSPSYLKITIDRPMTLELYTIGDISVFKKIGTNPEIFIGSISSTDYNTLRTFDINEPITNGVEIYILHEVDHYEIDEMMTVGVWEECFIDDITVKTNYPTKNIYAFLTGETLSSETASQIQIEGITNTFKSFTVDLWSGIDEIPKYLVISTTPNEDTQAIFWVDEVSLKDKEIAIFDQAEIDSKGAEISSIMGYTPTYNLVKGWDKALTNRGRIYYLNPFIEKRYDNYIFVSHIAPPAIYLWDIATFENFRELEKYDSNKVFTIELLPNNEILILKDSSITSLSDDGRVGITREPIYGVDCISKLSVVNINGLIFWCGKEEIYILNLSKGFVPEPMLKNTIRDLYLSIQDKNKIFGIRNRFNTYRIRVYDTIQKIEYLLTENGWVEERKWHFPEVYCAGFNNKLYFLSDGIIYEEDVDYSLPIIPYGQEQQSVETS